MVSIRRRRLLGLYSAAQRSTGLCEIPHSIHENGLQICEDNLKSVAVDDAYIAGQVTSLPETSESNPLNQDHFRQLIEVKRRKQHRRRCAENRELCTMRGVYYKNRKWQAAIKVDKKQIHLGTVDSEEEAARLYDRAAFMCGREPNLELSEEEKNELRKYNWSEFLALTRATITNKRLRRNLKGYHHQVGKIDEKPRYTIRFSGS